MNAYIITLSHAGGSMTDKEKLALAIATLRKAQQAGDYAKADRLATFYD